jgi:signal peptidase
VTAPTLVGGAPNHRVPAAPERGLRPAVVLRVVVAAVLVALAGLVVLALAPRLVGFQGHVVVSGSMEPRLSAGDVVLTRPVPPQDLQPGQVLLFPDPEGADRLVLHRLVAFDARGDLVTRGDANQSDDTTHVPASSVIGEAQLRVPHVGLPAYWRFAGQWGSLAALAVLLAAATVFVTGRPAGPRGRTSADRLAAVPTPDPVVRRVGLPPVPLAGRH